MTVEVFFLVFFVLWLVSLFPGVPERIGPYGAWCAWICVGLLAFHSGFFGFTR